MGNGGISFDRTNRSEVSGVVVIVLGISPLLAVEATNKRHMCITKLIILNLAFGLKV
jgi:hypothetical protein